MKAEKKDFRFPILGFPLRLCQSFVAGVSKSQHLNPES
jgi:hypothetical protein